MAKSKYGAVVGGQITENGDTIEVLWYEVTKADPEFMELYNNGEHLGTITRADVEQLLDAFDAAAEDR